VLYCIVLYCIVLYCIVLYCISHKMLRCVEVCFRVLQGVAVCCSMMQCLILAACSSVLQRVLQYAAVCCIVLQLCSTLQHTLQHMATHSNTLHTSGPSNLLTIVQHTASHGNTRQYTAKHCNTLQHTETRYTHSAAPESSHNAATYCAKLPHIATLWNTR